MQINNNIVSPFFGGLSENCDYSIIDISKWMFFVGLVYIIISNINGKYKSLYYSAAIVKYKSYKRYYLSYLKQLFICVVIVVVADALIFARNLNPFTVLLAILVIVSNFMIKGLIIFITTNEYNNNIIISIALVCELLSVIMKKFYWINPFTWPMINRYELYAGFSQLVPVFAIEIVILSVLSAYMIGRKK